MTATIVADPRTATILDAIGETPLIRIDDIWVKLEFLNPSGSVKARIARYMIERAEREGRLRPGDTIVEASSGNTGNAMSMVAAVKGYRMLVVMPDGMSPERAGHQPGLRRGGPDPRRLPRDPGAREGARAREPARLLQPAAVRFRVERRREPRMARAGAAPPAAGRASCRTRSWPASGPAGR